MLMQIEKWEGDNSWQASDTWQVPVKPELKFSDTKSHGMTHRMRTLVSIQLKSVSDLGRKEVWRR